MIFLLPLSPSSPPPPPSLLIKIYNKTLKEALHAQSYVGAGIQVCLGQTPSLSFSFSLSFSPPSPLFLVFVGTIFFAISISPVLFLSCLVHVLLCHHFYRFYKLNLELLLFILSHLISSHLILFHLILSYRARKSNR